MNPKPLRQVSCAALALTLASSLQAALLVGEDFTYPDLGTGDGASIKSANGGSGWSNSWDANGSNGDPYLWAVDMSGSVPSAYSPGVTSPVLRLRASGNVVSGSGTMDAWRNFAASSTIDLSPASQTVVYFSYLWARTDSVITNGNEFSLFSLRTASGTQLLNFGVNGDELLSIQAMSDATGAGSPTALGQTPLSVTSNINTTGRYLIVGKMVLNPSGIDDEFYLTVVNPSVALTAIPEEWDVSLSVNTSGVIGRLALTTGRYAGASYWDNIRIGTEFADVVGSPIPEPSSAAILAGVGALASIATRRRR